MTSEQAEVLGYFTEMLVKPTRDGGRKRETAGKPCWKVDKSHEAAIFSHITKWKRGERHDADSGAHPLVHAAWRCLAIAWQEMEEERVGEIFNAPPTISIKKDCISDMLAAKAANCQHKDANHVGYPYCLNEEE